jgi:hypothetical protein
MVWLLVALASIGFVEVLLRLPFRGLLFQLKMVVIKVRRVVLSPRISDHWKEKVLLAYAFAMLKTSVLLFGCLILGTFPLAAAVLVGRSLSVDVPGLLSSWLGVLFATLVAVGYVKVRHGFAR